MLRVDAWSDFVTSTKRERENFTLCLGGVAAWSCGLFENPPVENGNHYRNCALASTPTTTDGKFCLSSREQYFA